MEIRELLEKVQRREISTEMAEQYLKKQPFEELGFAKLDLHREVRTGFQEVVYCAENRMPILCLYFRNYMKKTVKYWEQEQPQNNMH